MTGGENILIAKAATKKNRLITWLRRKFVTEKMRNLPGFLIWVILALLTAYSTAFGGILTAAALLGALVGIPVVYGIVAYPKFGIMLLLVLAYLVFALIRLDLGLPVGTLADGIEALLILGYFIRQKKLNDWTALKQPIGIMVLIWIGYNILEVGNPWAESKMAWLYTIRSVALVMLTYFIFMLHIRSVRFLRLIIYTWIGLSVIVALYGLKQQFIGFSSAENAWLLSDPAIRDLLFIDDQWRKFSFLSDPVAFAYTMVVSSILCACLAIGVKNWWKKSVLLILAVVLIFSMLFSGTRGAYVMIPAGMVFYAVLNLNRRVLVVMAALGFVTVALILLPTSNPTIVRFQSAFKPAEDASFNLRKRNQERIRPYILSHPFGGGLGATGIWGQRFAPNSFLASFPPDSGYVRVAVELGWVGLLLFCILMFVILKTGVDHYYRIRDPELKQYCLAMLLIVFVLNIGNYPQEALVQFPTSIYFYLAAAIIGITYRLDQQKQAMG